MPHLVDGGDKVGRGIGDRAVEIEQNRVAEIEPGLVDLVLGQGRRVVAHESPYRFDDARGRGGAGGGGVGGWWGAFLFVCRGGVGGAKPFGLFDAGVVGETEALAERPI